MFPFVDDKKKRGRRGCPLFFRLVNGLRSILFFVFPLIPFLRGRIAFEKKNREDNACRSFALEGRVADCAFEVSSEGELEQVRPLLDRFLERGGSVEVLFASPSVEKKCRQLWEEYRGRVRILRMPLLTFFPGGFCGGQDISRWLTAPVLILCRYDFFPELFLYGTRKGRRFYLVSASLKNKGRWWIPLYRRFDKIVCSHEGEEKLFLARGWPREQLSSYEFRSVRILSRLERRGEALASWEGFVSWIKGFPEGDRLMVGNAWPAEMEILRGISLQKNVEKGKFLVVIVPHKTGATFVSELEEQMEGSPFYTLSHPNEWRGVHEQWKRSPAPLLFNVSGILLEFYSLFRYAVVGGGDGKGVHSLLEPFWAGCSVFCGQKVERSSEYDFLTEVASERVQIIKDWRAFSVPQDGPRNPVPKSYSGGFEEVAGWLLEDTVC